jgi:orotate phosphoribosyltransferase
MPPPHTQSNISPTALRDRLIQVIMERSLLRGTEIILASGASSKFYFDMKRTAFHSEGASLIAQLILNELSKTPVDYVGGLEMGAVPLVASLIQHSFPDRPIEGFFIRKQPKDHGTRRFIEGLHDDESLDGKTVVLLEDVTTTGGSVIKASNAVREEGALVSAVVTVVDRLQGAAENLQKEGIALRSVLTVNDFSL